MTQRQYSSLIIAALILIGAALIFPQSFIRAYVALRLSLAGSHNLPHTVFDIRSISFDTASSTATSTYPLTTNDHQNRLIIPRMGVDATVIESNSQDALARGLWHIPGSAHPGEAGNVVVTAHRWLTAPPSPTTFYLIDTLQPQDEIMYEYKNKRYHYRVTDRFSTTPDNVGILSQDTDKLTIFTCHPLFSTRERYVVTATLHEVETL